MLDSALRDLSLETLRTSACTNVNFNSNAISCWTKLIADDGRIPRHSLEIIK